MSIVDASESPSENRQGQHGFTAPIANETFNFRDFHLNDRDITGAQIAEAVGAPLSPISLSRARRR